MRGITGGERELLAHISRWGSDGYPVAKAGRRWIWYEFYGVKGSPIVYRTKKDAVAAFETFHGILLDALAGRI